MTGWREIIDYLDATNTPDRVIFMAFTAMLLLVWMRFSRKRG